MKDSVKKTFTIFSCLIVSKIKIKVKKEVKMKQILKVSKSKKGLCIEVSASIKDFVNATCSLVECMVETLAKENEESIENMLELVFSTIKEKMVEKESNPGKIEIRLKEFFKQMKEDMEGGKEE